MIQQVINYENDPDEAPGCHIYMQDDVYYNSNMNTNFALDPDYALVCTENRDRPNYHGNLIFQFSTGHHRIYALL